MFRFVIGLFGLLIITGTAVYNPDFSVSCILFFVTLLTVILYTVTQYRSL